MTVWQIGSGSAGRDYSQFLIEHDIACLGPGRFDKYDHEKYMAHVEKGLLKKSAAGSVRMFCEDVRTCHVILLRRGHWVVAIGHFHADGYRWREAFDDVRGWDLQHTRRVVWYDSVEGDLEALQHDGPLFGDRKQIPSFTRVKDPRILEPLGSFLDAQEDRPLRQLPEPPSPVLDDQAMGEELFARGLSHRATDDVVDALARLRRLVAWYRGAGRPGKRPSEHEVVAHMVLPLLLALGWSEQLLAVEWRRIDLAGFSRSPTTVDNCSLVCETKGFGHGLSRAFKQAKRYVKQLELSNCHRILLSDGGRFYLYERSVQTWDDEPNHYLNILKPRMRNVDGTSGLHLILALRRS